MRWRADCSYINIEDRTVILLEEFQADALQKWQGVGILPKKPKTFCSKMSKGTCKMCKSCV